MAWIESNGYSVDVPKVGQKGYDLAVDVEKLQVKQRTTSRESGGGYVIDGLRKTSYDAGLVTAIMVFETLAPEYSLNRILIVDAVHVFKHPLLYFSKYNDRHQLTGKRFGELCAKHGQVIVL